MHASPGDLWRAPMADAEDAELIATYSQCDARTVAYGHIHVPFVRELEQFTVANAGSVGSPYDGDPRASYLLVDRDGGQSVRVEYDIEREVALLQGSDYPDAEKIAEGRRAGRPPSLN